MPRLDRIDGFRNAPDLLGQRIVATKLYLVDEVGRPWRWQVLRVMHGKWYDLPAESLEHLVVFQEDRFGSSPVIVVIIDCQQSSHVLPDAGPISSVVERNWNEAGSRSCNTHHWHSSTM